MACKMSGDHYRNKNSQPELCSLVSNCSVVHSFCLLQRLSTFPSTNKHDRSTQFGFGRYVFGDATNTFGYVKKCMNAAVATCNATQPISKYLSDAGNKMQGCKVGIKGMPADTDLCFKMGWLLAVHQWQPEMISESHSGSDNPTGSHSVSEIPYGNKIKSASFSPKFGSPKDFESQKSGSASETHQSGSFASGSFKVDPNVEEFVKCMTDQFETCSKDCTASPPEVFGDSVQKCQKEIESEIGSRKFYLSDKQKLFLIALILLL